MLKNANVPIILAVNKRDLPESKKPWLREMRSIDVGQEGSVEISAKESANLNLIVDKLFELMPEGEPFYPDQQLTDLQHAQWVEELIREKCFYALDEELPYSVHVHIEDIEMDGKLRRITATIFTSDERYKGMIVGRGGRKLKEIGMAARKELEGVTGDKVYLELQVKTDPKWPQRFATS